MKFHSRTIHPIDVRDRICVLCCVYLYAVEIYGVEVETVLDE
jgi:hypothetical protein